MGDKTGLAISATLTHNTTVRSLTLDMSDTGMSDETGLGAVAIQPSSTMQQTIKPWGIRHGWDWCHVALTSWIHPQCLGTVVAYVFRTLCSLINITAVNCLVAGPLAVYQCTV
jgi:hypothetical protein